MWKLLIKKSDQKTKKWVATFRTESDTDGRKRIGIQHVYFGDTRYEDYTQHKDKNRRALYRKRHQNDRLDDPTSPGTLSYWILWGESTNFNTNLAAFRRKYRDWRFKLSSMHRSLVLK
jgi:hypothetical protein